MSTPAIPRTVLLIAATVVFCHLPGATAGIRRPHTPIELGRVQWIRELDEGVTQAKQDGKPILILFQEVPGCSTCQHYGTQVLSHPLVVEAAETLFVPVVVFNNRGGEDRKTLKAFNEPSWNNPVVRIIHPDRRDIVPRLSGDYTPSSLTARMVAALEQTGRPVPAYFRLLSEELKIQAEGSRRAVYSMHCFWSGEANLGAIPGVMATRPGFAAGREVVEVLYDPATIGTRALNAKARSFGYGVHGENERLRPDRQPKYQLRHHRLRHVPMTAAQAARVNAAIGKRQDPSPHLSPRQRALWTTIEAHPAANWPLMIERSDLPNAWDEVQAVAQAQPMEAAVSMSRSR